MYRITNTEFLKSNSKIIGFSNNHLPRGNHFFEATKKIFHRGLPQMMNLMARVAKFPSGRGRFRGSRLTNPQIRPSISILLSAVSGSAIGIVDRNRGDGVVDIHFLGRKIAKRRFQLSFPSGTYLFGRLFGLFSCYFFFFFPFPSSSTILLPWRNDLASERSNKMTMMKRFFLLLCSLFFSFFNGLTRKEIKTIKIFSIWRFALIIVNVPCLSLS